MITLEFDDKEMDYLFKVLSARPWVEVSPLMGRISKQIQEQENARNRPSSTSGPDDTSNTG
jgi:hypothetical protein